MRSLSAIVACCLAALPCLAASLPGSPLSPEAERAALHLADSNLVVELMAAEPNVRAPVALAWDADSRLFVAEMTDYPSGPVSGRIRMLEDRDGDGAYEYATIFATNLAFPNGVMPWKNGLLVTAAPDLWFLADTNGDGKADVYEKILTGFSEGNQQLRVNGLYWGIDNWIYGANGRSDGEARWADGTTAGSIRRRDFRFRPDTHEFEAIAGHSQFGMGHDDWGNRFPVFNNVPIRHVVLEDRYIERQPLLAGTDVVPSISPTNDGNRVFALTPPALLIPQPVGFFTSACGPSVYRAMKLPSEYYGNAFVCEPVQNVIQRRLLIPDGATFTAEYAATNEFIASTDPWFHGVFTATGPDGGFYVVDMYREWVEHPHWVAPEIRDKVDWRKGEEHGRIWRVRAKDSKLEPAPKLQRSSNADLCHALENRNGWIRDTAHRLLVERNAADAVDVLAKLVVSGGTPQSRVHALHVLDSMQRCRADLIRTALGDADPRVREHAVRLAEHRPELQKDLLAMLQAPPSNGKPSAVILPPLRRAGLPATPQRPEPDPRVRMQIACALNDVSDLHAKARALGQITAFVGDDWQNIALLSSAGDRPWPLLETALNDLTRIAQGVPPRVVERFAGAIGASTNTADADACLHRLVNWGSSEQARLLPLAAFLDHPRTVPLLKRLDANTIANLTKTAIAIATTSTTDLPARLAGIRVLPKLNRAGSTDALLSLLTIAEPAAIQMAAARALLEPNDPVVIQSLFARWPSLPKGPRQQLLASAARNVAAAESLLAALQRGSISLMEVDAVTRQGIERLQDRNVKAAANKLFASAASIDRESVVEKYKAALQLEADRRRGALVFEKNCTVCHQMQGIGTKIGPDLSGIGTQTRESLLVQILDPSRQVLPDYVAYTAETKDGETYVGFIAAETATTVTLRRPNEKDITVLRSSLSEFKTSGKSLMPDGLEAAISLQDMADLIEFLRRPDRTLFSQSNAQ